MALVETAVFVPRWVLRTWRFALSLRESPSAHSGCPQKLPLRPSERQQSRDSCHDAVVILRGVPVGPKQDATADVGMSNTVSASVPLEKRQPMTKQAEYTK